MARPDPEKTFTGELAPRGNGAAATNPLPACGGTLGVKELLGKLEILFDGDDVESDANAGDDGQGRLDALPDTGEFTGPLDIDGWDAKTLRRLLAGMISIRTVERRLARLVEDGHLVRAFERSAGQEAVAVGVAHHLTARDRVFSGHRSRGHYLAMGGSIFDLFAEMLGTTDTAGRGAGGEPRLRVPDIGFCGSVPRAGAAIPAALGAALSARPDGEDAVTVACFGDDAVQNGAALETLNLAADMRLPIVFVCEIDLEPRHLDLARSEGATDLAAACAMRSLLVDGNDVVAVAKAAQELIANARAGGGPGFLEAVTYRWCGELGPDGPRDTDDGRPPAAFDAWKRHDPVLRLGEAMIGRGDITPETVTAIELRAREVIANAVSRAMRTAPTGAPHDLPRANHG